MDDLDAMIDALARLAAPGRTEVAELKARLEGVVKVVREGQEDPAARGRAADEIDKLVATLGTIAKTAKATLAANRGLAAAFKDIDLGTIGAALTYFGQWLRAPTPESTKVVEDTVAQLRGQPNMKGAWGDADADKQREQEIDAQLEKDIADVFGDLKLKL